MAPAIRETVFGHDTGHERGDDHLTRASDVVDCVRGIDGDGQREHERERKSRNGSNREARRERERRQRSERDPAPGGNRRRRSAAARVRAGLSDGSVPVDAAGGWLHNIAGETYVVAPACFAAFATGRDLAAATVRRPRVVRLSVALLNGTCHHRPDIGRASPTIGGHSRIGTSRRNHRMGKG